MKRSDGHGGAGAQPPLDGDAYAVLGVQLDAGAHTIKARYHEIARSWHPDVSEHPEAEAVFAHVARCYDILKHPQQRPIYDFLLANGVPLTAPDRFQALYARIRIERVDFLIRHRGSIGWAIAGGIGALAGSARLAWFLRQRPQVAPPAASLQLASATSPPPPPPPQQQQQPQPPRRAVAIGGLLGGAGGAGSIVALGASGGVGGRFACVAALCGVVGGRMLLPWVDQRVGQLRLLQTSGAEALVAWSRPVSELAAATTALVMMRRAYPTVRVAELHLRALRIGMLGALVGHAVGRLACR
jgi:hypothetical protein